MMSTLRDTSEYFEHDSGEGDKRQPPPLPENLAALVGSIQGPADLGRNHDKYLDREQAGGAASA